MIVSFSKDTNCFRSSPDDSPNRVKCRVGAPGFESRRPATVLEVALAIYGPGIKFFYLGSGLGYQLPRSTNLNVTPDTVNMVRVTPAELRELRA